MKVNPARAALIRCREAEAILQSHDGSYWVNHVEIFKSAWSDLLMYAGRVFTKVEQMAKPVSQHWFGKYKHDRRADDLLCYMWHARNADEHGLAQIIEVIPGSIRLRGVVGKPFSATPEIDKNGQMTMIPGTKWTQVLESHKSKTVISKVWDSGRCYNPPASHLGKPISYETPNDLVGIYLTYITKMVEDLENNILSSVDD